LFTSRVAKSASRFSAHQRLNGILFVRPATAGLKESGQTFNLHEMSEVIIVGAETAQPFLKHVQAIPELPE